MALIVYKELGRPPEIKIYGAVLEAVDIFKYLGTNLASPVSSMAAEIEVRAQHMSGAFYQHAGRVLLNKKMAQKVRLSVYQVYVVEAGLYACETWNARTSELRPLEQKQFSQLRRVVYSGSSAYRKSYDSEQVYDKIHKLGIKIFPTECMVRMRQLRYLGHLLRMPHKNAVRYCSARSRGTISR